MKSKNWFLVILAAGIVAGGVILPKSLAAESPYRPRSLSGQWLEQAKEKLGLSEDQVQKIKTELRGEKQTLKDLTSDIHNARVALRQAIQAPDATETSVRAASARLASVEADLAVERLKLYGRISPIFTNEQLQRLKEFRAKID
jgi:Spy/CpxP family protein refolding chaperone